LRFGAAIDEETIRPCLTSAARAADDSRMPMVRGLAVRCVVVVVLAAAGCRGGRAPAPSPAPAPAPEQLTWPAVDEASLAAAILTEGHTLGLPEVLAIAPDGSLLYRRSEARDPSADLYQLNPAGLASPLATAKALLAIAPGPGAAAGSAPRGIETIELSSDGNRVLVPLAGRVFVVERATGAARELVVGTNQDPRLSPDGKQVAFVRDGDLWVAAVGDKAAGPAVRITQRPADREYGVPEPGADSLGRRRGFWWSPDSQAIAFQRSDLRALETLYLSDPRQPGRPPVTRKVAHSGKPIATVDLGVVAARGGAPRWVTWELARYPYLARVIWPVKGALTVVVANRAQTQVAALAVDPATGATRPLVVDKDPEWVDLAPEPLTWLEDGSGFLWISEASGARSLDRYASDGTRTGPVVTADVGLRRVVGVIPGGRELVIEATTDPRELHVLRVPLAGGRPWALTKGGGVHRAQTAYDTVAVSSSLRGGGRVTAVLRGARTRIELPTAAEPAKQPPTTKLEQIQLDDHVQYAAVTRPHSFDAKVRYPVLLAVHAVPGENAVVDASDAYVIDQWWADAGFIVVRTDARGTPGRDRAWERAAAGDLLTLPMNDHIGAIKLLGARFPQLDRTRVGAVGTGIGGHLATLAVMLHPDAFAAGVARTPITDWELVDAAYGERYLRMPSTNADGYRRTNAASYAEQLRRPLLILHGLTDDRIFAAHALRLIAALSSAGKRVELAALPATRDLASELAAQKLQLAFLREHLGPPARPAVMPAPRGEEEEMEEERRRARGHAGSGSGSAPDRGDQGKGR
jgi:dipeptidyl-peptidase 4